MACLNTSWEHDQWSTLFAFCHGCHRFRFTMKARWTVCFSSCSAVFSVHVFSRSYITELWFSHTIKNWAFLSFGECRLHELDKAWTWLPAFWNFLCGTQGKVVRLDDHIVRIVVNTKETQTKVNAATNKARVNWLLASLVGSETAISWMSSY